jgi:hypothetical protein
LKDRPEADVIKLFMAVLPRLMFVGKATITPEWST